MITMSVRGNRPAPLRPNDLPRAARLTFKKVRRVPTGTIDVAFVTPKEIRRLNRAWRGKDRPTDVLSFSTPSVPQPRSLPRHWGDIVIAPTVVRAEAQRRAIGVREETVRMFVHGLLHLFGYDHATAKDEERMFALQEAVVDTMDL